MFLFDRQKAGAEEYRLQQSVKGSNWLTGEPDGLPDADAVQAQQDTRSVAESAKAG